MNEAGLVEAEEKQLYQALGHLRAQKSDSDDGLVQAMAALAEMRAPIDAFFDAIIVNAEDEAVRANRLGLLAQIREVMMQIADFSKIEK